LATFRSRVISSPTALRAATEVPVDVASGAEASRTF